LFGAALVVIVSGIMAAGLTVQTMVTAARMISAQAGSLTAPAPPSPYSMPAVVSLTSSLGDVFGLALLYAPFALLALTVFEPIGSFGVAFRRDFGPLLACTFFAWAAARLPFALLSLALPVLGPGPSGLVGY